MKQFHENADQALLEFFHKSDWIKAYLNEENQNILKNTFVRSISALFCKFTIVRSFLQELNLSI